MPFKVGHSRSPMELYWMLDQQVHHLDSPNASESIEKYLLIISVDCWNLSQVALIDSLCNNMNILVPRSPLALVLEDPYSPWKTETYATGQ